MRSAPRLIGVEPAPEIPPSEVLVEARALEKWFGPHPAVRKLDFTLRSGEFLTLFGPNGAGKTTLLKMLAGSLKPTRGELRFAAAEGDDEHAWRRRIGVLSHQTYLYSQLSAEENLRFYARLYALPDVRARIEELLTQVGLLDRAGELVRTFSRGMQQRLALARTLLHDPQMVLLDEPYTGLDPHAARMLRGVLAYLRDGRRTILLVTHNLSQGLELADRVVIQVAGRWVYDRPRASIDAALFEQEYSDRVGGAV
jgi:heme exporter protein A